MALAPFAEPADAPLALLLEYGRLLLAANTVASLTGARDWETLLSQHFLDCVEAGRFVPDDARHLADWGAGAGLPGIVWAILFPEKQVLLIERNNKKAQFLQEAILRLELFNARVLAGQGEETIRREERPDVIVVRAVEPLARLLERFRRGRVQPRSLFLMVGPSWREAWDGLDEKLKRRWVLSAQHPYSREKLGRRAVVVLRPR